MSFTRSGPVSGMRIAPYSFSKPSFGLRFLRLFGIRLSQLNPCQMHNPPKASYAEKSLIPKNVSPTRRFTVHVPSLLCGLILLQAAGGCLQHHCSDLRPRPQIAFKDWPRNQLAGFDVLQVPVTGTNLTAAPPVIVFHELPGMYQPFLSFATNLSSQGYTVYLPVLFGKPGDDRTAWNITQFAVNPFRIVRWHCFRAGKTSPIVGDLRALCHEIAVRHPNQKIGVIGMCLTGTFPLAMTAEPQVNALVLCQPATPIGNWNASRKADLSISPMDLELAMKTCAERRIPVFGVRFELDTIARPEKFTRLQGLFGAAFKDQTIREDEYFNPDGERLIDIKAHSVFCAHFVQSTNHPTQKRFEALCDYLDRQLNH